MKIWFPTIRARSGSDVYVERLVAALRERGIDARLQWFESKYEYLPQALVGVMPPEGTTLIHANSWNGFAFARPSIPLVVTAFHCVYRNGYPHWKSLAQSLYHDHWIGRYEHRSFRRADATVVMTPSAAEDFDQRFTMPSLTLIHGWVDTDVFTPGPPEVRHDGPTRILIVGNASKRKGIDLLPKLITQLGDRFEVTIIGGLRSKDGKRDIGATFRRGLTRDELIGAYQASDIVVSLSRYEGFGYSVLEAMACGKPVVAFNAVGIRDVVASGVTGLLAPTNDLSSLVAFCERLSLNPQEAQEMGMLGRELSLTRFSKNAAVEAYVSLYEQLAGKTMSAAGRSSARQAS